MAINNSFDKEEATKNVQRNDKSIYLRPITEEEMRSIIEKMPKQKAPGEDKIPMKLIAENKEVLIPILTEFTKNCFIKREYPEFLKICMITPI